MKELAVLACIYLGVLFMLLAAVGLVRFPDVYSRMHATSKGSTLGLAGIFVGVALYFGALGVTTQAALVIVFVFLTAPVGAHAIARAAYRIGVPLWDRSVADALRGRYDEKTGELTGDSGSSHASADADPPAPVE